MVCGSPCFRCCFVLNYATHYTIKFGRCPILNKIHHEDTKSAKIFLTGSVGREIANIDNLFVSPSGLITIVETKLWRNPEGHRTVVAQILEYAKTLSLWTYQELDKAVQKCSERMDGIGKTLYELVKKEFCGEDADDIELILRSTNNWAKAMMEREG